MISWNEVDLCFLVLFHAFHFCNLFEMFWKLNHILYFLNGLSVWVESTFPCPLDNWGRLSIGVTQPRRGARNRFTMCLICFEESYFFFEWCLWIFFKSLIVIPQIYEVIFWNLLCYSSKFTNLDWQFKFWCRYCIYTTPQYHLPISHLFENEKI